VVNTPPLRPTIKDVARVASVSQSTVSYILNNARASERISAQTKERVWLAAQQLGYKFNPIGRALQRGYTSEVTLLVVSWNLATSHAATAMAISRAAARQDFALTVHVAEDDKSAEDFVKRANFHSGAGLLVLWDSPAFETSALSRMAAEGVPVIDLLPESPKGISTVTADREDAGFRGSRHLIELGHRFIGMIGDTVTRPKTTIRKLAGYRKALAAAGISYDEIYIQNVSEFGFEGGRAGLQQLLSRCPAITGIFCINDAIALGAIDAATELGRTCPANLSVVGFGDAPEGRYWRPKLTTIALASDRVAEQAMELIIDHRSNPGQAAKTVLIPEELIVRDSTAAAPDRGSV
jgi:DNA-binding LacI/PurR family transcriptional regulator